jgi:uncharacterized protein YhaN
VRLELLDLGSITRHRLSSDLIAILGGIAGILLIFKAVSGSSPGIEVGLFAAGLAVMIVAAGAFLYIQRRLRRLLAAGGFSSLRELRRARRTREPEVMKIMAAQGEVLAQRAKARQRIADIGLSETTDTQLRRMARDLPALQEELKRRSSWEATAERARAELMARAARLGLTEQDPYKVALLLTEQAAQADAAESADRRRGELQLRREERLNGRDLRSMVERAEQLRTSVGSAARIGVPLRDGQSADKVRVEYDQARARRDQLRDELLPREASLQQQLSAAGDLVELEEEVAELKARLERMERAEQAVNLAISELQMAEGEIQNNLAPLLAEGLSRRLPRLTHSRYSQAWVDPSDLSMHVAAPKSNRQVPVENLSQGTQEQIYVCLRMVLAQALSPKGEQLPLIFDDPSVNSDDHRCMALLDTLLELSETSQVVIFSHERRVAEWAGRRGVPVLSLAQVPASVEEEVRPVIVSREI